MRVFIDESGSFSWHNPGVSLFASLLTPDSQVAALEDRFHQWKRNIIGKSKRELKGEQLTSKQLLSFAHKVLPNRVHTPLLTIVGVDTGTTKEDIIRRCCSQVADQFAHCSKLVLRHNPGNKRLAQSYVETSGWVRKRSPQNFLWVAALAEVVLQSVQHLVAYFYEEPHDSDFENIEILIDRSFIQRDRHVMMWKEWLRNGLMSRNGREPFVLLDAWAKRGHPFVRKYEKDGVCEFNDLYQKHMHFHDSEKVICLQVADIVANICYRYYRGEKSLAAYHQIRPRIVGKGGRSMTILHLNEDSLYKDSVENHVGVLDVARIRAESARHRDLRSRAQFS